MTAPTNNPIPYGPPITLQQAKQVVAAAQAEAIANGWPMVIVVTDSTGHVVLLEKMDNAQLGSIAVAQLKAETSVKFRRSTKVFEDGIAGGGVGLRVLSLPVCVVEGGLPLIENGKIIGAIGVSGMQAAQDGQVAAAGVAALR